MLYTSPHPKKSKYVVFTSDIILPGLITLFVGLTVYLALFSDIFAVKNIRCEIDYTPCPDTGYLIEVQKLTGQNIFRLDDSAVKAKLLSGEFTIREAIIHRRLPSTLEIELLSVYPVIGLMVKGDPHYVALDSQYRVISVSETNPNVPILVVSELGPIHQGKKINDEKITKALDLALSIINNQVSFKTIEVLEGTAVKIELKDGKYAIMTTDKDIEEQITLLHVILSDPTMMNEVTTIDVRFSQPVLK